MPDSAKHLETQETRSRKVEQLQAWLGSAAQRIRAQKVALVVRQGDSVKVSSHYPQDGAIDGQLVAVARRALRNGQILTRAAADGPEDDRADSIVYIGVAMRLSGRPAAIAVRLHATDEITDAELLSRVTTQLLRREEDAAATRTFAPNIDLNVEPIQRPTSTEAHDSIREEEVPDPAKHSIDESSSDPQEALLWAPSQQASLSPQQHSGDSSSVDSATRLVRTQGSVINALATVLEHNDFAKALHAFAAGVAQAWNCQRVVIGIVGTRHIVIKAVSGVVDFDPRSALMVDIGQALEETRAEASSIVVPAPDRESALPQCHVALARQLNDPALMSVPLLDGDTVIGAVLLERDTPFSDEERNELQRMALLVAPVIALKKLDSMGLSTWLTRFARRQLRGLLGSSRLTPKLAAIAIALFAIWSTLYTQMFRVDADASIEASVHRAVVANFPSFLSEVEKRAGDVVYQGEVLARLDVEELRLDRVNWAGELDKLSREYRATLAQRDRSNIRIVDARRAQAQSQLDLLDAQIARATLRAPIDGVVVSGDLSQSLGSPVERGELLFEVASLDDYRLALMVDEADIGFVQIGDQGNLRLRSLPDQSFPFTVSAITPVSEPGSGANRFRVEATLTDSLESVNPGMGGVAKIEIEPRAIGWIWTRSFINWMRFQFWKYGL